MNGIMVNGSGYPDPTAGKAMAAVIKEEKKMNAHGYADGDIVTIETVGGEQEVLLLKCHRTYATTLKLSDRRPEENSMAIRSKGMMYTDTGRYMYAFYDKIISLVRSMKQEEFDEVKKKVAETLGVATAVTETVLEAHEEKTVELDVDAVAEVLNDKLAEGRNLRDEFIRCAAERDVYKKLFEDLMEKGAK